MEYHFRLEVYTRQLFSRKHANCLHVFKVVDLLFKLYFRTWSWRYLAWWHLIGHPRRNTVNEKSCASEQTSGIPTLVKNCWNHSSSSFAPSIWFTNCIVTGTLTFYFESLGCLTMYKGKPKTSFLTRKWKSLRRYQSFCVHSSIPDSTYGSWPGSRLSTGTVTNTQIFHHAHVCKSTGSTS